jgi:hypothetical protein
VDPAWRLGRIRLSVTAARRWAILSGWLAVVLLAPGCTPPRSHPAPVPERPVAVAFKGLPQVGALFAGPSDQGLHFCTASVVHSPAGNVIATAAHCLAGTGAGLLFVPGYHDGLAPYGTWAVEAAYVDPRWLRDRDPQADYAFLTVSPHTHDGQPVEVEHVVGGDELVINRSFTTPVTVVAYPGRVGGRPIRCAATTYAHQGYPGFDCRGYVAGTSGGPWLTDDHSGTRGGQLFGVIGGLHQGGCAPDTSYTSHLDDATAKVFDRAARGGVADTVPAAGGDGC